MQPIASALRARAAAQWAALPARLRLPASVAAAVLLAALLLALLRSGGGPALSTAARDAAADALFRRATVSHVLGAPVCPVDAGGGAGGGGGGCGGALAFLRYTPAPLEEEWAARAPDFAGRECAQIASEAPLWQAQLDGVAAGGGAGAAWSVATYRDAASGAEVSVALEPLAGVMRDPRPICEKELRLKPRAAERGLDSRDFTLLDAAFYRSLAAQLAAPAATAPSAVGAPAAAPTQRPRALLFDLGATRWDPAHVTGFRWTVEAYARLGIHFDEIFAWEALPVKTLDFFGPMPLQLAARTHLFNVPVARPGVGGVADALAMLREAARPQDFVVFKLDIDHDVLEEEIALALLQDDALAARVDDFYFEHHADTHGIMDQYWGVNLRRTLHESVLLFQAFRKRGIRAHSWP